MVTFKVLRKRCNKTCNEIADSIKSTKQSYSKYECSERIPSVDLLLKLKNAYDCSSDEILIAATYHINRFKYKRDHRAHMKKTEKT